MTFRLPLLALPLLLASCSASSQDLVSLELRLRASGTSSVTTLDNTVVGVETAELAFGALYLCPGASAGALCGTARAEWLESQVLDLTSSEAVGAGALLGISGSVRSYMYDLGIASLLTSDQPLVSDAAEELGGHSLLVRGVAQVDDGGATLSIPYLLPIVVAQMEETERGQPVVRSSSGDGVSMEITTKSSSLEIRFDLEDWLEVLEAGDFVQYASCDSATSDVVCSGTTATDCVTGEQTECTASGLICAPSRGCEEEIEFEEASRAYRAVSQALVAGARPVFTLD